LKVSVVITAFNHAKYVGEALDSVLMQQADFPVEILVGDDGSTDGTREIIAGYAERHPDRVFPLFPDEPMGYEGGLIFEALLERARGEYIALLDADDYWLAEDKLGRQVAVLEEEHECAFCFHDTVLLFEDGSRHPELLNAGRERVARLEDLLGAWNPVATSSVLYRNRSVEAFPQWLFEVTAVDWALNILNARHGDIAFIDRPMSAYRLHSGGLWSRLGRVNELEEKVATLSLIESSLASHYVEQLEYTRSKLRTMLAVEHNIPAGRTYVLVATGHDDQFLALDGRHTRRLPLEHRTGRDPASSESAIAELEDGRRDGAEYLLIPDAQRWWLEFYDGFAAHLDACHTRIWTDADCTIYSLESGR
jgi:glycosyltransferase involved in cell wall biosynthesis